MIDEIQLILQGIGDTLYDFLVLPGKLVLAELVLHAPALAKAIGITGAFGNASQLAVTAAIVWLLFAVLVWRVIRLCESLVRTTDAIFRTLVYRMRQAAGNLKTTLICKFRQLLPRRSSGNIVEAPMIEFDERDLAVIRTISSRGPGFALSAPEIAEQIRLRPAQVQKSLDRLFQNRLLDSTIGSTDGFDTYRLTDYGAAFMATLQRQEAYA